MKSTEEKNKELEEINEKIINFQRVFNEEKIKKEYLESLIIEHKNKEEKLKKDVKYLQELIKKLEIKGKILVKKNKF